MTSNAQTALDTRSGRSLTAEQILLLDAAVVGGAGLALLPLRRPVAALLTGGGDDVVASGAPIVAVAGSVLAVYALAVATGVQRGQTARVLPAVAALNGIWVAASAVQVLLSFAVPKRTPLQPASGAGVAVIGGVGALVAWFAAVQMRLLRGSR